MTPATRSLLRASADGDISLVRALLSQGTDVNGKTAAGQTPLMLAAAFGHAMVVKVLLAAGADIELQDELGFAARDWAGKTPEIAQLFDRKSEPGEQPENTHETEPPRSSPVEPSGQSDTEPEAAVLFPDPKAFAKNKPDIPGAGLGGLAGAILRERAVKPTNEQQTGNHVASSNGPTARSEFSPATSPLLTGRVSPPDDVTSETGHAELTRETETGVTEEQEVSDSEIEPAQITSKSIAEEDETTISGKRREPESANTLPRGRTLFPHEPVMYKRSASAGSTNRIGKVDVPVPSFSGLSGYNFARLIRWALVVIFLLAGAAAGYFLSNYLLKRDSQQTIAPASSAPAQPTPVPPKPGPVVGGALAGSELFLPDAEFPNATSPPGNADASGSVTVQVNVDQRGTVRSAKAMDGDGRLQPSAVAAAKRASFSPDKLRGKGRIVSGTVTYTFIAPQQQPTQTSNVQPSTSPTPAVTLSTADASKGDGAEAPLPKVNGALAGAELNLPQAAYPARAKAQGITGTVTIVVRVNRTGRVVSWRTAEGDSRLRSAALTAAKKSTFSPDKLPGTGDVVGTITYTFR